MSDASMFDRITRRIQAVIGRGRINVVNDTGPIQYVQISYSKIEPKDNTPRVMEYGYTSNPPAQTDAALVHVTGDRSNAICVGTNHQPSRPKNLATGEAMLYQLNGIQVYLSNAGLVINAGGLPVVCNNATNFTVNCSGKFKVVAPGGVEFDAPTVASTGDFQDNMGSNSATMKTMRQAFNPHYHSDPQGGNTGLPDTSM